jgi:hypothetical protein
VVKENAAGKGRRGVPLKCNLKSKSYHYLWIPWGWGFKFRICCEFWDSYKNVTTKQNAKTAEEWEEDTHTHVHARMHLRLKKKQLQCVHSKPTPFAAVAFWKIPMTVKARCQEIISDCKRNRVRRTNDTAAMIICELVINTKRLTEWRQCPC